MSDTAIDLARLGTLLREHLHMEVPSVDADLLESGVLDSLQLVDLLLLIEQQFGRRIPIESIELDDLRSLRRLAQLLGTPVPAAATERQAGCDAAASEAPHGKVEAARAGVSPRA